MGAAISRYFWAFVALLPAAWLAPNHYYPWLAAWPEFVALALLCTAAVSCDQPTAVPRTWLVLLTIALASAATQAVTGRILFSGDALMVSLYLLAFAGAIALGTRLPQTSVRHGWTALEAFALGVLLAAAVSTAFALMQWAQVGSMYVVALRPGTRPYANVAQANHFCSLAFLGLCALWLLYEARHLGRLTAWVGSAWLLAGMAISGSRTGWLQIALLTIAMPLWRRRAGGRFGAAHAVPLAVLFVGLVALWPRLNEWLLTAGGGRGVGEQIDGGVRLPFWRAMLDAISREPWWGYGWQQVSAAQQAVALDHPPVQRMFEHSHNLVLDLLLWAGIPVGGTLVLLIAMALFWQVRAVREPRAAWLTLSVGGLLIHGLLEYPLEYAYFLIPAGLSLGAAHALAPGQRDVALPARWFRPAWLAFGVLLAAVAVDYFRAEENHRLLRLETAGIGTSVVSTEVPALPLLTQLHAYLYTARHPAHPAMSAEEVDLMRRSALRWAYPPMMLRYALAAGLNGRPAEAGRTLRLICATHLPERCREADESWRALQQRYPQLGEIPPP